MRGFDEAWYRDYQAKRASHPVLADDVPLPSYRFTLARPTILLNELVRLHWRKRGEVQQKLSTEIARLIPYSPGRQPLQRAKVIVERYSVAEPDWDGMIGGLKLLIDCLLVRSKRHPDGLGLILDDDPAHLTVEPKSVVCGKRKEQRTEVQISPLECK